jgi:hypothetical protein
MFQRLKIMFWTPQVQVSKAQNDDFGEMTNVFGVDFRD